MTLSNGFEFSLAVMNHRFLVEEQPQRRHNVYVLQQNPKLNHWIILDRWGWDYLLQWSRWRTKLLLGSPMEMNLSSPFFPSKVYGYGARTDEHYGFQQRNGWDGSDNGWVDLGFGGHFPVAVANRDGRFWWMNFSGDDGGSVRWFGVIENYCSNDNSFFGCYCWYWCRH